MNTWRSRILTGLVMFIAIDLHQLCTSSLPNTPAGMLLFHGSAAGVDLILLYAVSGFVSGRLCDDMESLCLASAVVNFVGWLLYMAYAPPIIYNVLSWGLSYVQWGRLLLVDGNDADHLGFHLVRGRHHGRAKFYS